MPLTIAYIGFGKSTNRYHLPYVLIRDSIRVKSIYNRERKPELEQQYEGRGIFFTNQIEDILNDGDIQMVSICTPPDSHYEYAKLCLEAGKHILVEKPFCTTKKEAEEITALAKEKGLVAMPYQNRRFDGDFLAVKEVLQSGKIGGLVEIESHFDYYRPDAPSAPGKYYEGALYGLGVHTIDQMISLFGRPHHAAYDIRSVRNTENPDDLYEVQLFYDNFKAIVKTSHLVLDPYPKWILHGTKGSFIKYGIDQQETCLKAGKMPGSENFGVDPEEAYGKLTYIDAEGNIVEETVPTPQGDYGRIYDLMYESIINGAEKLVRDEELLANMEILERGFEQPSPSVIKL
ncbi:oxidoreductase [Weizmannia acidilactici]|uniref:Oxidoreductase n=1 Tax=Weizmannia acidilactici TaxID=2607726 RepID=A0A5J4JHN6_9BACI|nr:oxidoreductase [Weizmannia acidilactici]GER67038.1 oxidoreductase [Weizmannia acidilactici]GER70195.1 oxidoreductase [Weizmannia acidilactici]GER73245.1 oxidoreductase [Weizmannia acidilactici]